MKKKKMARARLNLYQSMLIFLLALASITGATYAWFTLSSSVRLHNMTLNIIDNDALRIDIQAHEQIEQYFQELDGNVVLEASASKELYPVSSTDGTNFYDEDGTFNTDTVNTYLEVPLHFMSTRDMYVHLSGKGQSESGEGTNVSGTQGVEQALRISFTADGTTKIYEPYGASWGTFSLEGVQSYREDDTLFFIEKEKDKTVIMRVWIEGTDPQCTDELRKALYEIELYFAGTDENNIPYE